jgi:hypothetical protein
MQTEEALRLRQNWAMKGNPPCNHNVLDNEYYWGKYTGSYVCTTCGKSFTREEWDQEIKNRDSQLESVTDSFTASRTGRLRNGIKGFMNRCAKLCASLFLKVTNKS